MFRIAEAQRPPRLRPGHGLHARSTCSLVVLIPLSTLFWKSASLGPAGFWQAVTAPRVVASYKLTFGAVARGRGASTRVFGLVVTWVLVRYRFPGRRLMDALVDFPFALPTAVAGITLTTLYAPERLAGRAAREARDQGRLHPARHHARPHLHRPALRGAHAAARAREPRPRGRGGRGQPGREPLPDDLPRRAARALPGLAHRLRARLRARAGRVRLASSSSPATCR